MNQSKLDDLRVQIHFKENGIPSIHAGLLTEESKIDIKLLMLIIYKEALEAGSVAEMSDKFRKLVEAL